MVKLNISLLIFLLFFLLFTSSHVRGATISGPSFPFEANIGDEITIQMESDASSIDSLEFYDKEDSKVCEYSINELGRPDGWHVGEDECTYSKEDGTHYMNWIGSYDTVGEYQIKFEVVKSGDNPTATQTITITKRPPSIEEEPTFEDGTLEWDFNLNDYSFDDDVTISFYKDDEDYVCVMSSVDTDGDCEISPYEDEYTFSYTGYEDAGEYSPKLGIHYGADDPKEKSVTKHIGPEINNFQTNSPITLGDDVEVSYDIDSEESMSEIKFEWENEGYEGDVCSYHEDCSGHEDGFDIYDDFYPDTYGTHTLIVYFTDEHGITATHTEYVLVEEGPEDEEEEELEKPKITDIQIVTEGNIYEGDSFKLTLGYNLRDYKRDNVEFGMAEYCDYATVHDNPLDIECTINNQGEYNLVFNITDKEDGGLLDEDDITVDILEYIPPEIKEVYALLADDTIVDDDNLFRRMSFRIQVEADGTELQSRHISIDGEGDITTSQSCPVIDRSDGEFSFCTKTFERDNADTYTFTVEIDDGRVETPITKEIDVIVNEPDRPSLTDLRSGEDNEFFPGMINSITASIERGTFNLSHIQLFIGGDEIEKKDDISPDLSDESYEISTDNFPDKDETIKVTVRLTDIYGFYIEREITLTPAEYDCFNCDHIAADNEEAQALCEEMLANNEIHQDANQICHKRIDMNCDGNRLGRGIQEYQCHELNQEGNCDVDLGSSLICKGSFEDEGDHGFWEEPCQCTPSLSITSPTTTAAYSVTNLPRVQLSTNLRLAGSSPISYRLNEGPRRQYTRPFTARNTMPGTDILKVEAFLSREAEAILEEDLYTYIEADFDAPAREDPRASEEIQFGDTTEDEEDFFTSELERTGSDLASLVPRDDVDRTVESSLTANYYEGRTEMELHLTSENILKGTSVVLEIPKCAAELVNEIMFDDDSFEILQDDPLIAWHFEEMDRDVNLRYEFSRELDPDCIAQMRVMSLVREIGDNRMDTFLNSPLFPILIIPVVASILIYFSKFTATGKPQHVSNDLSEEIKKIVKKRKDEGQSKDEILSDLTQEGFDEKEIKKAL